MGKGRCRATNWVRNRFFRRFAMFSVRRWICKYQGHVRETFAENDSGLIDRLLQFRRPYLSYVLMVRKA